MPLRRRDLFKLGGLGGGVGLAGAAGWSIARWFAPKEAKAAAAPPDLDIDCSADPSALPAGLKAVAPGATSSGVAAGSYGAKFIPPAYLAGSRDLLHTPPPRMARSSEVRTVDLSVVATTLEVAVGESVQVWAYGGTVPGPILRATVGDRLRVRLGNHSGLAHSVHFHGAHDVMQDGLQRVAVGEDQVYELEAGPVGLHPYHCHIPPYAWHLRKGMYGAMIVDPAEGRAPAHEFVLCLCGFDTDGDGRNDVYAWNGRAGYYDRFPLKVPVGELVRLYLMNMVEHDPIASFHLHAQTFDLYRSGTSLTPHEHTDIVSLGPAERAIVEFRLPRRGRYMFHPHQSQMAERGAMGWIVAI